MPETIIPTVVDRRGELTEFHGVPEGLPDTLGNFAWPRDVAKQLREADKVTAALYEAHAAWVEAHEEFTLFAPAADQAALEEAIRAGKPDPGTPNTTAADRAEHVAWTRLQLALTDARQGNTHKQVLKDYLSDQAAHLAEHELARETAHAEATAKAAAIMSEAEDRSNQPGRASAAMKQYVAVRWSDEDDLDTLLVAKETDSDQRKRYIAERNAGILERWKREVAGEPEPEVDPIATGTASELDAAVAYGSAEAAAELRRRKVASRS